MFSLSGCKNSDVEINDKSGNTPQSTVDDGSTISISSSDCFTDRDQQQEADLSDATYVTVASSQTYNITKEGVYVFSGEASECQIVVEAGDEEKVQLVLDGLTI